jgi:phosphate transport system permease protein
MTTATASQPATARPAPRRALGASLAAHGEPMVWLTGGALIIALTMIAALLGFIVYQGTVTFWPAPLIAVHLADGRALLGDVTRHETYQPDERWFDDLDPQVADRARAAVAAADGLVERRLLRTGNFDLTNTHFQWIDDVLVESEDRPEWALVVERLSWGRFHGLLEAFLVDGQSVAQTPADVWRQFQEHHPAARERWRRRRSLEDKIGQINDAVEDARLELRGYELREGRAAAGWTEREHRLTAAQQAADRSLAALKPEIETLNAADALDELVLSTADGQQATIRLADIVRAYPANRLGWGGRLGVYLSRWREFLTDDPREANSEGGVYPAIFGTVLMTLLMTLAVVPFGVLAALYLREYAKAGPVVAAVRIAINNLAGVPSIVFGVFGLGLFCYILGGYIDHGSTSHFSPSRWFLCLAATIVVAVAALVLSIVGLRRGNRARHWLGRAAVPLWLAALALTVLVLAKSPFFDGFFAARSAAGSPTYGKGGLIWASLTLALLTLPVVIVATEEALAAVPRSMREGSYACGAGKWQTIHRIVLPRAMPGIMTGMILAMARGAGEVAPLMLVGAAKLAPKLPLDGVSPFLHPQRSFMHLAFHVFDLGFQSPNSEAAKPMVFTTTLLLIAIIAMLNLAAVWLRARLSRRFTGSHF